MSDKATVTISRKACDLAEKRAAEVGLSWPDEYVEELILSDDLDHALNHSWLREKIEEGLASGSAGELTRDVLSQLVEDGIARAARRK